MIIQDRIKKILNSHKSAFDDCISPEDFNSIADEISKAIAKKYSRHIREVFKWIADDLTEDGLDGYCLKRYQEYLLSAFKDGEAK